MTYPPWLDPATLRWAASQVDEMYKGFAGLLERRISREHSKSLSETVIELRYVGRNTAKRFRAYATRIEHMNNNKKRGLR